MVHVRKFRLSGERGLNVLPVSKRSREGYLLIDNRVSGGELQELPTITCAHCNVVVVLNMQRTRPRGHCWKCAAYVCDKPGCNTECNPITQGVELALKYPDSDQPFLLRGDSGEILFNPTFRDKEKPF